MLTIIAVLIAGFCVAEMTRAQYIPLINRSITGTVRPYAISSYGDTNMFDTLIVLLPEDSTAIMYPAMSDTEQVSIVFEWDTVTNQWKLVSKEVRFIDSTITYRYVSGTWVYESKSIRTGDSVISYSWDNVTSSWQPVNLYIHRSTRPVDTIMRFEWDSLNSIWILSSIKFLFYTGPGGLLDSTIEYTYNPMDTGISTYRMVSYTSTSIVQMRIDSSGGGVDTTIAYWTLDANGHVVELSSVTRGSDSTACRVISKNTTTMLSQWLIPEYYPLDSFFAGYKDPEPDSRLDDWGFFIFVSDSAFCKFCDPGGACWPAASSIINEGGLGISIKRRGQAEVLEYFMDLFVFFFPVYTKGQLRFYFPITSAEEMLTVDNLQWWIDPASGNLYIDAAEDYISHVFVYTMDGKLAGSVPVFGSRAVVPMGALPPGNYIVNVIDSRGGSGTIKIIWAGR